MMSRTDRQWRYRGSAVVLRTPLLSELLTEPDVAIVSLREALGWLANPPSVIPGTASGQTTKTILVGGLDPIVELIPRTDAEAFLRQRVRSLISMVQDHWSDVGLILGTNIGYHSVRLDHQDHVLLNRTNDEQLQLSASLWNGSAGRDLSELRVSDDAKAQDYVEGYYVRRLS